MKSYLYKLTENKIIRKYNEQLYANTFKSSGDKFFENDIIPK